jgi:farnesyl-diphosphate farnesyltransferase
MMIRPGLNTASTETTLTRDDLAVWLNRVSRTFALTIRMLQEPFRSYASAAYLLCRMVDTVEDCESLTTDTKCRYLLEFCGRLLGTRNPHPNPAIRLFPDPVTWEERLTQHEPAILAMIRSFPEPIQDIIFRYVVEMAEGMVMFLEQQDEHGFLHFESDEQLDQYCYYVAGTVGMMMNEMFADISGTDKSGAKKSAVELGIGLQLTNIVKDIQKDLLRNIHYCPAGKNPHWPGQASAQPADDPGWEIRSLASSTISHLTGGMEYILNLESNLKQYKLFCVINYLMAWKTLETCIRNPLLTASPSGAKISRASVYFTLLESHGCVVSNQFLNWRADRLRKSCTSLVLASDKG